MEKDKKRIKKIMNLWKKGEFNTIYVKYVSPTYKEIVNKSLKLKEERNFELDFKEMLDHRVKYLLPNITGFVIKEISQDDNFHILNAKILLKNGKKNKMTKVIFLREDGAFKPSKTYGKLYINPSSLSFSQRYSNSL
jgi:hypothetical protein